MQNRNSYAQKKTTSFEASQLKLFPLQFDLS